MAESTIEFILGYPKTLGYDCSTCKAVCCSNTSHALYAPSRGYNVFPKKEIERMILHRPEAQALVSKVKGDMVFLARVPTGCVFLRGGKCQIHEDGGYQEKPIGCRLYPFFFAEMADCVLVYHHSCANHSIDAAEPARWDVEGSYEEWVDKGRPPVGFEPLIQAYNTLRSRRHGAAEELLRVRKAVTLYEREPVQSVHEYLGEIWKVLGESSESWDFAGYLERVEQEMLRWPTLMVTEAARNAEFADTDLLPKLIHNRAFRWETLFHDTIPMMKVLAAYALLRYYYAKKISASRGEPAGKEILLEAHSLLEVSNPFRGANRRALPLLFELNALFMKPGRALFWHNLRQGMLRRQK